MSHNKIHPQDIYSLVDLRYIYITEYNYFRYDVCLKMKWYIIFEHCVRSLKSIISSKSKIEISNDATICKLSFFLLQKSCDS